jgi:acetyl esterase
MPGPADHVTLRLFDVRQQRPPGPVVVFFHGGGFVIGNVATHSSLCAEVSRQLDLPVVSVDYRLAPEHPWPAAPDDAEAAVRWISDHADAFEREFTSLVVCGDSAGATLTLVTAIALRDQPGPLPVVLQVPLYPATDPLGEYPSNEEFAAGYGLDRSETDWYDEQYRPEPGHWRGSPLYAELAGLPPTVLMTAALDPLRDQGRAFAAKLVEAGVTTTFAEAAGMVHGFATFRQVIPSAQGDVQFALDAARSLLASSLLA